MPSWENFLAFVLGGWLPIIFLMQYKFFVDGEWRHDDRQPYVPGEYGIVNTVLLATDPNYMPVVTPDMTSGSNMDVDNEAFRRVVRISDTAAVLWLLA